VLDIELAGSVAPGAILVVYYAPNTDSGFIDAISTAVHDTTHKPSVISISYGGSESAYSTQSLQAMNQIFQDAAVLGITVCCAASDHGAQDGASDGLAHADFPAASPFVLACGGHGWKRMRSVPRSPTRRYGMTAMGGQPVVE
jgi:kumamolisin